MPCVSLSVPCRFEQNDEHLSTPSQVLVHCIAYCSLIAILQYNIVLRAVWRVAIYCNNIVQCPDYLVLSSNLRLPQMLERRNLSPETNHGIFLLGVPAPNRPKVTMQLQSKILAALQGKNHQPESKTKMPQSIANSAGKHGQNSVGVASISISNDANCQQQSMGLWTQCIEQVALSFDLWIGLKHCISWNFFDSEFSHIGADLTAREP